MPHGRAETADATTRGPTLTAGPPPHQSDSLNKSGPPRPDEYWGSLQRASFERLNARVNGDRLIFRNPQAPALSPI